MDKNLINNPKEIRKFGIVLSLILGVIGYFQWRHGRETVSYILWSLGCISLPIALIKPLLLRGVFIGFMKVALVLGWINTRILLFLVFYLMVMPIGLCMRLFGKDLLNRKIDKKAATYWVTHDPKPLGNKHYEKQF